ncbi:MULTISPECIES: hypothetical protein [unclassified Lactobacillus]|uniref:hypothetical protein n=1 Tax=unclassified Lactobacillus TaxID=2620435 RepID=UPI00226A813D|nr:MULTISPECIES: hypothetical protein [unclassified Lactobacillus]MCX8733433.1 BppU family phage baseplate upper protein [Lactobacillus sp. B4015]MCX8735651.1 BppU family phage baseplate upper protein [Lactobacillus sp. B4012]
MSLALITLPTNKSISTVSDHVRKIGQGEKGQKLDVIVTDANGSGYDLTDRKITFSENKEGGKIVSDNETAHFNVTDEKAGRFTYTLADAVYAASGIAWFDISSKDGDVIDTTKSFNIDVIQDETIHVNNDNYVSSLTALETHYKAVIQKTEDDSDALFKKWQADIDQLIKNGNTNIQTVIDSANQLINNWKNELINQQKAITDLQTDWKNQTEQINADYNAQKKAIQSAADNQLSANKTASDKAIAQIETDKQAAIKQANTDFQAKLASIQSDYNTWKANAIDDFQSQINKLASELKNDEDAQAKLQQAIDSANKAIANINNVDFTKFAHLSDLENYYDKATMDQKLAQAGKLKQISVNGGDPIDPDADGVANLDIPQPDLSSLETKTDAKTAHDTLTADIAKRVLSINDVMADKDGKVVLPDFNHPTKIFKDAKVDPNTLTSTGIYELKNSDLQISLDSLPGFTQTNATYGYILIVNNAALDNTFQVIICRQMQDFILDYRYINKTYSDYPKFNRVINTQDLSNVQNQMIEMKQSMMRSWTGTLTQYQVLTSYDPMTIYFIISDYEVVVK